MMYVFINKEFPRRIKMIEAISREQANELLNIRLSKETVYSGVPSDYKFGYKI